MRTRLFFRVAAWTILGCLLTASVASPSFADVHLPAIESDNMVLQAGSDARLFGSAAPAEKITITYGARSVSVDANNEGHWQAVLPRLRPGENFDIVIAGKNTVTIKNVLVGQVWLCGGQSNMEFPLIHANDGAKEMAAASNDKIRLFSIAHRLATTPVADVEGSWRVCDPTSAGSFSAVGYFFGRALNKDLKTPIGLISDSWGGTAAQAWISMDGLEADPVTRSRYAEHAKTQMAQVDEMTKAYDKTLAEWKATQDKLDKERVDKDKADKDKGEKDRGDKAKADKAEKDKAASQPKTTMPDKPVGLKFPYAPTMLYNGMIAPIEGYTIGGVIWYQGESNAHEEGETMAYRRLFPALIRDWRNKFHSPRLPFLYVQLANFEKREDPNERSPWAELREAQLLTLSVPYTGMAVAVDIGDEKDIHPKNKQDVGKRLERIAMARVYGKSQVFSGPIFTRLDIRGSKVVCCFDHTDLGLKAKGDGHLVGFVICGADKKFVPAEAVIVGRTVVVSSPKVSQPVAVRYAWAGDPLNNLYNGAGLPASPFRSDVTVEGAIKK